MDEPLAYAAVKRTSGRQRGQMLDWVNLGIGKLTVAVAFDIPVPEHCHRFGATRTVTARAAAAAAAAVVVEKHLRCCARLPVQKTEC